MTEDYAVATLIGRIIGVVLALWLARWFSRDAPTRAEYGALRWVFLAIAVMLGLAIATPLTGIDGRASLVVRLTILDSAMALLAVAVIPTGGRKREG